MRTFFLFLFSFSLIVLKAQGGDAIASCYFSEPQPKELIATSFPEELHGVYYSREDSISTLTINDTAIIAKSYILFTTTVKLVNEKENVYLKDDEIYGLTPGVSYPYIQSNDTIFMYYPITTVFFSVTENVLTKNNGYYFLNFEENKGLWTTIALRKNLKGGLIVSDLNFESFIDFILKFEGAKEKKIDGNKALISSPTVSQFQQLADRGGYNSEAVYFSK